MSPRKSQANFFLNVSGDNLTGYCLNTQTALLGNIKANSQTYTKNY